jgi:hypothetical protein
MCISQKTKVLRISQPLRLELFPNRTHTLTDEIELKLNIELPDNMFERPDLEANIEVEANTTPVPTVKVKANAVSEWLKK